jgi:hypothetical protein
VDELDEPFPECGKLTFEYALDLLTAGIGESGCLSLSFGRVILLGSSLEDVVGIAGIINAS